MSGSPRLIVRRVAAYLTDVMILFSGVLATQFALKAVTGFPSESILNTGARIELWVLVSVSLPSWTYFVLFESSHWQSTPGKRLLGLQVVDRSGARLGLGRAIARTLVKVIPWEVTHLSLLFPTPIYDSDAADVRPGLILANVLLVLYLIVLLVTRGERTIHDLVAKTRIQTAATNDV